jgi:hypothetical protein
MSIVVRTSVSVQTLLGITEMGSSIQNKQRTALVTVVFVMLLTLAGCASLPKANPPDPKQLVLDIEGQLRQFKGFTPQQVLEAAEEVLRRYQPEAKFVRSADTLKMESHHVYFLVFAAGQTEERWAVHAREEDQVTVASVAMDERTAGDCFLCGLGGVGLTTQLPKKAKETIFGQVPAVDIDYGMFWHRVQSILTGAPWPECLNVWEITIYPRYFEPLCSNRTRDRYEAK